MPIKPIHSKWDGKLTDRERFHNQMHYKPIDRCFNMEFGYWKDNFIQWPLFYENGIKNNTEADIFFNFDITKVIGGHYSLNPLFEEITVSETETKRVIIDQSGVYAEIPKDGHSTIPHYIKSTIQTPEDWKKVKEERYRRDDPVRRVDVDVLAKEHPSDRDYPLGVNCGSMIGKIRDMLTLEGLAYAIYDYPEMVEDMVESRCQLVEDYLDQVLYAVDFDYASGWEDISSKSGPLVPDWFFRDIVFPRYKRIGDKIHAAGIDLWYTDCDGDVRPLLPYFLKAGINCLFPYEVNSCVHVAELLSEYGKELRIMGGVDKMELGKGREAIKRHLESLVSAVERGGYIPFCDHRCPPNVNPDDYLYYLDLKEKMFGINSPLYS